MTCLEMTGILSKQWANVNDIKKIACCGRDNASFIRDSIYNEIIKNGMNLPISREKIVPMNNVIKYLNIDIDYIYSMAEKEKNLIH